MATIALYREQINRMPGLIRDVKQTVTDYQNELSALKRKVLKINKSICNLDDVICQIEASTRLQEEKSDSLDKLKQRSNEFTQEAVRIDESVAEVVQQRSDNFYEKYGHLKPECRKSWTDKAKEWFTNAGAWCKEHWKAVASVVLVIAAVVLLCTGVGGILGAIALGALLGGAIGGVGGGLISMAMGGTFWEGFEDGAFAGVIGGMLSGGMGFAIAGKAALTLGETIGVGAVSGGGVSFVNDMGSIIIGGETLSLGEVIRNTLAGGVFGGVFAGIGYGISKACAGVWNKLVGSIKGGTSIEQMPSGNQQTYTSDLSNVTGRGARARDRAIQAVIKEDFPDLKLTYKPEYSPFIRTGVAQRNTGTQIGKNMFSSRANLRDTIIHEELHHRWWQRGIIDHHPMNSLKEATFYKTIDAYKQMRGW